MGRRSKKSRQRGSHTHGSGSKKKRRGAGSRGGRGNAGSGKKGDGRKPSYWKNKKRVGKLGFTPVSKTEETPVNVGDLYRFGSTEINLSEEGYDKLLGAGKAHDSFDVTVKKASSSAIQKIEDAGGSVTLDE